jgi:hypothetical protein
MEPGGVPHPSHTARPGACPLGLEARGPLVAVAVKAADWGENATDGAGGSGYADRPPGSRQVQGAKTGTSP